MGSKQIRSALKRRGIEFKRVACEWTSEPGEMVRVYVIELTEDSAEHFDADAFNLFDETQHALQWIEELEPFTEATP